MQRTTVMADEILLKQLRAIAREERISLAEVIRQGMELRVGRQAAPLSFIASGAGERAGTTGRDAGEVAFKPEPRRQAREEGRSLNAVRIGTLRSAEGLGGHLRRDLSWLAGTLDAQGDADEALADQRSIDPELWSP